MQGLGVGLGHGILHHNAEDVAWLPYSFVSRLTLETAQKALA
jgi:hypothetical protein